MTAIYGKGEYFKKDINRESTTCPYCKDETVLTSYTAIECVRLFCLPIFPLRKYRHLNSCPSCNKRLTYRYKDWKRISKREMQTHTISYLNSTNRSEAAINMHHAYCIFQSKKKSELLALKMEDRFQGDPDIHRYLAKWYLDNEVYWKSAEHCKELYNMNLERLKHALILARLYFAIGDYESSVHFYKEKGLTLENIDIKRLEHITELLSKKLKR